MTHNARWIWADRDLRRENEWICFRTTFTADRLTGDERLEIFADSYYVLYLNGQYAGCGPARSWPHQLSLDAVPVRQFLHEGENTIAVLVQHFGTSTSQYRDGEAGLICSLETEDRVLAASGESWKVRRCEAFSDTRIRVSYAYAWVEEYDAARAFDGWTLPGYDDTDWQPALSFPEVLAEKRALLSPCGLPQAANEPVFPKRLVSKAETAAVGRHYVVNFSRALYPESAGNCDREQTAFLACQVKSPCRMTGRIHLLQRRVPLQEERIRLNGREYVFPPEKSRQEAVLEQGDNFMMVSLCGRYQHYVFEVLFDFPEPVRCEAAPNGCVCPFAAVGPLESAAITNVMADGGPQLPRDRELARRVWESADPEALAKTGVRVVPVESAFVSSDDAKIRSEHKTLRKRLPVLTEDTAMLVANGESVLVPERTDADIEYVLDFGRECCGFLAFELEAAEGTELLFECYEYHDFFQPQYCQGVHYTVKYRTKEGFQRYRSPFKRGFRYVTMTIRAGAPVRLYRVLAYESRYAAARSGRFLCSDQKLNRIWEICANTVGLCMQDTYVDCPAMEQAFWIGDARDTALSNYYVFGAAELSRRSLLFAAQSLKHSDLPEAMAPGEGGVIIPDWSMLWVIACWEYYLYSEDAAFIREAFPFIEKTAETLLSHLNGDGLLEIEAWNMIDWADMDTPSRGVVAHQNALLARTLTVYQELCRAAGSPRQLGDIIGRLKDAVNRKLWSAEKRAFADCIREDGSLSPVFSVQTNVMLLLCGCVSPEHLREMTPFLPEPPAGFVQIGSPFMQMFYYEALAGEGRIAPLIDSIRSRWGEMLEYDATSCWETFPGYTRDVLTRSHCHAWSTAPSFFLGAYVLGVRPLEPGFDRVLIAPEPAGLSWAEGSVMTPHGQIDVRVECREGQIALYARVPESIRCDCILPQRFSRQVRQIETY